MHEISFKIGVAAHALRLTNGQLLTLARQAAGDSGLVSLAHIGERGAQGLLRLLCTTSDEDLVSRLATAAPRVGSRQRSRES